MLRGSTKCSWEIALICARCHRPMLAAAIQVEDGNKRLPYGPRCAVLEGLLIPARKRARKGGRRVDKRQGALALEASP